MKSVALISLFCLCLHADIQLENRCVDDINQLSSAQIDVLSKAYWYGEPHGFGLTLAAIAWKESCAGEYRLNFQDPSAGIFHAHIPTVLKRYPHLKNDAFTQNRLGELLVKNDDFAAKEAIDQLLYWQKVNNNHWDSIIKSYNKGFSWKKDVQKNKMAIIYLQDIKMRYDQLYAYKQHFLKKPNLIDIRSSNSKQIQNTELPKQQLLHKKNVIRSFHDGFLENISYQEQFPIDSSFQFIAD